MRKILITLYLITICIFGFTQNSEFETYENGLIYSNETVDQLHYIVDSINQRFKDCTPQKSYYSNKQAKGIYFRISDSNLKILKEELDSDISLDDFLDRYAPSSKGKDVLVVLFEYENYKKEQITELYSYPNEVDVNLDKNLKDQLYNENHHWYYEEYNGVLDLFYLQHPVSSKKLPVSTSRRLQYVDCLIDTNSGIYSDKAYDKAYDFDYDAESDLNKFMNKLFELTKRPNYEKSDDYDNYLSLYQEWEQTFATKSAEHIKSDSKLKKEIEKVYQEALTKGNSNDRFEEVVGEYYSKDAELKLKRSRVVVGHCSMDNSPRIHAFNIAILAAETVNWEIFLRAHLDIMTDNFSRMSDGSYAWGRRLTYIKELELLEIDVLDLLIGVSTRIGNPAPNQYYGNISRIGRALSEYHDSVELEQQLTTLIGNEELDDYNRLIGFYIARSYLYNQMDPGSNQLSEDKIEKLNTFRKLLPDYLATHFIDKD